MQTKCMLAFLLAAATSVNAASLVQLQKLIGSDATGAATEGSSAALSADGSTAVEGGPNDSSGLGAAWVFTESSGTWTQQGPKLVGSGASTGSTQGRAVAISSDGDTVLVGGPGDSSSVGALWVFTRSAGVWTQQGEKLVGTGAVGAAQQGTSVALSADGNTALVGGPGDNSDNGAAWVFTRSGGVWTQQGNKLVGSGAVGAAQQGRSVALSADGNTALVGGPFDTSLAGAVWVFTRSSGNWTQQGPKLVGTNAFGAASQGYSVALSADGNTALFGGDTDNSQIGAAWVFTRSGSAWTQEGDKLVGWGHNGLSREGWSVALSANGNTALVGGIGDNWDGAHPFYGATWIFDRSAGVWTQRGEKLLAAGAVGNAQQGSSVALSGDGDTALVGGVADSSQAGATWLFVMLCSAPGDLNGDGVADVADVFYLINHLFAGGPPPVCR